MTDYGDVPITVALVAEERHLGNRALVDAQAAWHAHGCRVEVLVPDAPRFYDVSVQTPPWSVVVSRGRHLAGLETVLLRRWVVLPKRWSTLSGSVGPVTRWPPPVVQDIGLRRHMCWHAGRRKIPPIRPWESEPPSIGLPLRVIIIRFCQPWPC